MSNAYNYLAQFYDELMDVDYKDWANYLEQFFSDKYKEILDLGCGTASLTNEFYEKGYTVVGVDSSKAMLNLAWEKYENKFVLLHQNIRGLDLNKKFDVINCSCDVINYITEEKDLIKVFRSIKSYLKQQGLFMFDISSRDKLENDIGSNTFAEEFDNYSYIWQNNYQNNTVKMDLSFFVYDQVKDAYQKYSESHTQRSWNVADILRLLELAGYDKIKVYECFSKNIVTKKTERIQFLVYI